MSDLASAKILVVDGTPANVKLWVAALNLSVYAASAATNGRDALAAIASDPPDLVLLDSMMPGMSGYEVCQRIRANADTALLPVVLCTSRDPQAERIRKNMTKVEADVEASEIGPFVLKGLAQPAPAFAITRMKEAR
jgi:CheY-like chemotaxis protein